MGVLVAERRLEAIRLEVVRAQPVRDVRALAYLAAGEAKYGEPFWVAERIKTRMRAEYAARAVPSSWEKMAAESREFWEEYEEVNRLWLPEDPVYTGTRAGATLATTADLWTLTSPSAGQTRILEHYLGGESTSSTVLRFAVQRSTTGSSPTNQTPEKMNTRSPAAASTFATAWTGAPTLTGNPLIFHAFNTFGGTDRWVPAPGEEIYQVNAELVSGRSQSGTPVVSSHLIWEEL